MRLAIITTHPIQYYAPVFKLLNQRINIKVFYTWGEKAIEKFDPGFGKAVNWDIPLLDGYDYEWIKNTSTDPGSHHFRGIINPDLVNKIEAWQADAVLIYGWAYHSHLKTMRYFKNKIPVYFRGDSTLLDIKKGVRALFRSVFLKWVYQHVDHAFYVGTNNKAYFKKYGLKENQLSFAPHAIDNDRFAISRHTEAMALRLSLQLTNNDVLILFAGKFESVKNAATLIAAVAVLNLPNIHLLLVGNGVNEAALKAQANLTNCKNIHFMSFQNQDHMPVLYQAADLFCLPSISETWGLSVNEAMACTKPVLLSDKVGAAADLVTEGINGYTFKAGNVNDLKHKLNTLLNKGKSGLAMMGDGSKNIIKNWNFEVQAKAIENKVLHEASRPY